MLGLAEGEWVPRPVEDVLWGLFPGTAEPQTLLTGTKRAARSTPPAGQEWPAAAVEGTYSILNPELREAVIVAHPGGRERAPKSRLMEDVLASIPEAVAIVHGTMCSTPIRRLRRCSDTRRGGQRRQSARTDCAGDAPERACDAGKGCGPARPRGNHRDGAHEQGRRVGGCGLLAAAAGGRRQGRLRASPSATSATASRLKPSCSTMPCTTC
jgi:hypothetical protein